MPVGLGRDRRVSALAPSRFSYTQLRNGLVLSLIGLEVSFTPSSKSRKCGRINEGSRSLFGGYYPFVSGEY